MLRSKKAFTIVELVIVIAIIAILAAVLIPTFGNLIKKANESNDKILLRDMNNAIAIYGADNKIETATDVCVALKQLGLWEKTTPKTKNKKFVWNVNSKTIEEVDKNDNSDSWILIEYSNPEKEIATDEIAFNDLK